MPRKLHDTPLSIPCTIPFVVVTRHEVWRLPSGADTNALTIMASRTSVDWPNRTFMTVLPDAGRR